MTIKNRNFEFFSWHLLNGASRCGDYSRKISAKLNKIYRWRTRVKDGLPSQFLLKIAYDVITWPQMTSLIFPIDRAGLVSYLLVIHCIALKCLVCLLFNFAEILRK